ncbi:Ral Gtpase-Activating Protein Subunit Alpha-1 [Manis pentadactyla]|nr:Ral Gtpase-Activating Protein Subunit Alpha-1 [Manis pentadactyla]
MDFWFLEEEEQKKGRKVTLPEPAVFGICLFFPFISTTNLSLSWASRHGLPLPGTGTAGDGLPETEGPQGYSRCPVSLCWMENAKNEGADEVVGKQT